MNTNWRDMSPLSKLFTILSFIVGTGAVAVIILKLSNVWTAPFDLSMILIGACTLLQTPINWNSNRKIAMMDVILGSVLVALGILNSVI